MHGLCLISGINYSGKGMVKRIMQEQWEELQLPGTFLISGSRLIIQLAGLKDHNELAALNDDERKVIRNRTFESMGVISLNQPVFHDDHFIFEDREIPPFDALTPFVSHIVHVSTKPEVIMSRIAHDEDIKTHPGRMAIAKGGIPFVEEYASSEYQLAQAYHRTASQETGKRIGFTVINNSGEGIEPLVQQVSDLIPQLMRSFEGQVNTTEGQFMPVEGCLTPVMSPMSRQMLR